MGELKISLYHVLLIIGVIFCFIIMALRTIFLARSNLRALVSVRCMSEAGSGAGKGGGAGGSIKDAGGAFGKMEVAQEEQYFRKENQAKTKALKGDLKKEVKAHEKAIKEHQAALDQLKKKL